MSALTPIIRTLAFGFALVAGTATALPIDLRLEPARPTPGQPFSIRANGTWPQGCAPRVTGAYVEGQDIVLQVQPAPLLCSGPPQPATLASPANAALQLPAAGSYRLRMRATAAPGLPPRDLAFNLAHSAAEAPAPRPEAGFWWPLPGGEFGPAGGGIGAMLETQGDMLAINVAGYGTDGQPTWWMGAAPLDGPVSRLSLTRLHEGRGPFDRYAAPKRIEDAGELLVEWQSAARAVFWFVRPHEDGRGIEVRPLSVTRFAFASQPGEGWRGRWVLIAAPGTAPRVLQFDQIERGSGSFLLQGGSGELLSCMLDAEAPDSPPLACQLSLADGATFELDDLALQHLRGRDSKGIAVQVIKLDQ